MKVTPLRISHYIEPSFRGSSFGRSLSRSSGATQYLTARARQHLCALLMMASSMFGAKQRISKPLSALAVLTGRRREIKHPRPKMFGSKRVSVFATDR